MLSIFVLPTIFLSAFISFVSKTCLVLDVSAYVSSAYVIIGVELSCIYFLYFLSLFIYLFLIFLYTLLKSENYENSYWMFLRHDFIS
jgi:hypothetical protein